MEVMDCESTNVHKQELEQQQVAVQTNNNSVIQKTTAHHLTEIRHPKSGAGWVGVKQLDDVRRDCS